jgi:hypothetical protein
MTAAFSRPVTAFAQSLTTEPPMHRLSSLLFAGALVLPLAAAAADPVPEIEREPVAPQQTGALHALRTIPEACARLQGQFSSDPAEPYRFAVVRTSAACQPRARLLDAARAKPSAQDGWLFNDRIRVPSADCPSLAALVEVWRRPAATASPSLDAQGKARVYLEDAKRKAEAGKLGAVPAYAVSMRIEGKRCGT